METKIVRKARISEEIEKVLNQQIANEMRNSFIYRSMANCLEYKGWKGAVKLYKAHSDEERGHAEKIIQYMQDRDCIPQIPAVEAPQKEYVDIKDIILKTDLLEQKTTKEWREIASKVSKEDLLTFEMSQWFLLEQIQEESSSNYWVNRVSMLESTGAPLYHLDKEMEES